MKKIQIKMNNNASTYGVSNPNLVKSFVVCSPDANLMRLCNIIFLACTIVLSACSDSQESTKVVISNTCSLDNVAGATGSPPLFTALVNSDIEFQGWVADAGNGKVPKKVLVELVNSKNQVQFTYIGNAGQKRADVAAALKTPSAESAGFSVKTKVQGVTPGEYEILLAGIYDEQITVCNSNRKVIIK